MLDPFEWNDILTLSKKCHVPENSEGFDRQLMESDFHSYLKICENILISIRNKLKQKLNDLTETLVFHKIFEVPTVHLLILCGEHSASSAWSTKLTIEVTTDILNCTLQLFNTSSVSKLVMMKDHSLFKKIILKIRPKLLSATWKRNPAAVQCYYWILMQVEAPYLDDYMNDVLPTALLITDDFESSYRIKGLLSVTHIINNVTKANLEMYGHPGVILDGLHPIFYHNESEILEPLLLCFIALMRKIESSLYNNELNKNVFDDIFYIILNNTDLEERSKCKIIYLKYLADIIYIFRLRTLRYSRKLFDMIARDINLQTTEEINRLWLEVLDSIIKTCWPRINLKGQCFPVLLALFKLIHDYSPSVDINKISDNDFIVRIKTALQLMKKLCSNEMELIKSDIINNEELNDNFKNLLDFVLV